MRTIRRVIDWKAWHDGYADANSGLSRRLKIVQDHVREWLDETAPTPVKVISSCAGDGRDLLEVLAEREDSRRVRAGLLEFDPRNVARAIESIEAARLTGVTVACADAGLSDSYLDAAPADLILLCGVFGNIDDQAIRRFIRTLPQLCRESATVIWTRHRREPDLTPTIRDWLEKACFEEISFTAPDDAVFSVGRHRFVGAPQRLQEGVRLFTFVC